MKVHEAFGIQPLIREESYVDRGNLDRARAKLLERERDYWHRWFSADAQGAPKSYAVTIL